MNDAIPQVELDSRAALERWLAEHHATSGSVWLVTWKKHTGAKYVSTAEVLDALIAWGWIDGRRKKLDADRTMQLISPRAEETWAQTYKDRAARLIAEGRMQAPGQDAIARSKRLGLWDAMAEVDALVVPDDLSERLKASPAAERFFMTAAPSYRRNVLRWIARAKRPETRDKRISETVARSAAGEKVPQMEPGRGTGTGPAHEPFPAPS